MVGGSDGVDLLFLCSDDSFTIVRNGIREFLGRKRFRV